MSKSPEQLQKEIDELRAKLGESEKARKDAEDIANIAVLTGTTTEDRPTGKTVKRRECINPWETNPKEYEFKVVERPTYFYTINLPLSAGWSLRTNGAMEYFHGQTYEFDNIELADIKSRVARCWDHEASISGSNENAYRQKTEKHLKMQRG